MKFIILTEIPNREDVWWKRYIKPFADRKNFVVDIESVADADISLFSLNNLFLLLVITIKYLKRYRCYDFIITFQANVSTAWIGILRRIFRGYNQRHIVLQFHRKERDNSWKSKIIYLILGIALKSADKIICSSREEISYYKKVLSLTEDKFMFIPLCVDPKLMEIKGKKHNFIIAAGKTLRDYKTLVKAVEALEIKLIIISDKKSIENVKISKNVKVLIDVPYWRYIQLMARSKFVVIPLEDRLISTGQSVALSAMALGKAVIITKTKGTIDYFVDNFNGLLVEPRNVEMMRRKIKELMHDEKRALYLGKNAREFIQENCLITRYLEKLLSGIKVQI